ncbi:hypothetical protein ACFQMA_18065 [Halosimplex aquaticum]|uniref:DUF4864 domain-containing protein n=1 Tax=Halosimplex aquaticum TaxID=3026162 RepID=A0ABD5Y7Q6_9EURY|nr:hypothetical protein [Halosimplex aquaticum]
MTPNRTTGIAIVFALLLVTSGCITQNELSWTIGLEIQDTEESDQAQEITLETYIGGSYGPVVVRNVSIVFVGEHQRILGRENIGTLSSNQSYRKNVTVSLPEQPEQMLLQPERITTPNNYVYVFEGLVSDGNQYLAVQTLTGDTDTQFHFFERSWRDCKYNLSCEKLESAP